MTDNSMQDLIESARSWWSTDIIEIRRGHIGIRGYPIQELIGELSFPEMVWLMLRGEIPSRDQAKLLEATMVAAVDHGPHAPSIAISRMAVTCGLPINGAMASAINALDDVHGGPGQQCMELMQSIVERCGETPVSIEDVDAELDNFIQHKGSFVPGFGHRWHGTDPRAVRLLALARDAQHAGVVSGAFIPLGALIEQSLERRKGVRIPMNIDGINAIIHSELGFPPALGRGLFILSRSVGILAHAWEQSCQGGRIKGPMPPSVSYRYTGAPSRHYTRTTSRNH